MLQEGNSSPPLNGKLHIYTNYEPGKNLIKKMKLFTFAFVHNINNLSFFSW
ncbi:hypothetical protein BSG1_17590 [Bacillus sp. SG-1]|nr:hypothetical protein BSG1_17590 [Bacillus sp. SG-1]